VSRGWPPELDAWIRRYGETAHGGTGADARGHALLDGAMRALEEAVRRPGRDRDGAHALLAADALLTRACEEAAEAEGPEQRLLAILARLREREGE
jgi:hypothetical protein